MLLSQTEENYLKAIYTLSLRNDTLDTSTNEIAEQIRTKPPTVSDMLRKLTAKDLVRYEKYKRVQLSKLGQQVVIQIIRKHRLWETFLQEKLNFSWDEVHEVAEQLEHIHSEKLVERLEKFLGYPKFDPHGDPIPTAAGEIKALKSIPLSKINPGKKCQVVGVKDTSTEFLKYLQHMNIAIGTTISVLERISFDQSLIISLKRNHQATVSEKFTDNVLVIAI